MASRPVMFPGRKRAIGATRTTRAAVEVRLEQVGQADPLLVEFIRDTADLVDSARRIQDARLGLSTSQRLERLLGELGAGEGASSGDRGGGGRAGGDGAEDPLGDVLGSGPTMGDGAQS